MSKSVSEIVFVLDRSGSMGGMESDTIGGFNSMLAKQKGTNGEVYVTTVLFDNRIEILHDHLNLQDVNDITDAEYYARGSTALLDAIGFTVKKMDNIVKHSKSEKVMFVIITDGYENASREYSKRDIKKLVNDRKEKGWEFVFLGANIDSFDEAESIGISRNRAANYHNDAAGIANNFSFAARACQAMVEAQCAPDFEAKLDYCMEELNEDYNSRK